MEADEFARGLKSIAGIGISTGEASVAFNRINEALYKIMVDEIKELAKSKGISFKEAEQLYFTQLARLSGKRGRLAQVVAIRRARHDTHNTQQPH